MAKKVDIQIFNCRSVLKKWASVASIYSVIIDVLKKKTNDKVGVIQAITRIFVAPIGN